MIKRQIRKELSQLRTQLSATGILHSQGRQVIQSLEQHPLFVKANRILLFHSLPDEVNTHDLIERYRDTKSIVLPTVVGDELELHTYDSDSPLTTGAFNISESLGPVLRPDDYHTIDLAIIPGVAFDRQGNRLGRGKGFYDRLLPKLQCPTIGICYPCQLISHIPCEPHDRRVDEVICE